MSQTPDDPPRPDDELALDRLLADPAAGGVEDAQVRELVEALRAPGTADELAGEGAAVSMFATEHAAAAPQRADRGRAGRRGRRLAVAGVVVAAGMGATAVAAYSGALPDPVQRFAHRVIAAPEPGQDPPAAPSPAPDSTDTPGATASASASSTPARTSRTTSPPSSSALPGAAGLCRAFSEGGLATTSAAYRSLETAAGGADRIDAYCADVAERDGKPKRTKSPSGSATSGAGSPSETPSEQTPPGQAKKSSKSASP